MKLLQDLQSIPGDQRCLGELGRGRGERGAGRAHLHHVSLESVTNPIYRANEAVSVALVTNGTSSEPDALRQRPDAGCGAAPYRLLEFVPADDSMSLSQEVEEHVERARLEYPPLSVHDELTRSGAELAVTKSIFGNVTVGLGGNALYEFHRDPAKSTERAAC